MSSERFFQQVFALVHCIPLGRVATYGQIARLLGQPHAARTVGWAMRSIPEGSNVPWQRVVNAEGRVSISDPAGAARQRALLESEGVVFEQGNWIDLSRFGWVDPPEFEIQALLKGRMTSDEQK